MGCQRQGIHFSGPRAKEGRWADARVSKRSGTPSQTNTIYKRQLCFASDGFPLVCCGATSRTPTLRKRGWATHALAKYAEEHAGSATNLDIAASGGQRDLSLQIGSS